MKVLELERFEKYLLLKTSKGKIRLQPIAQNIIRISYTLDEYFSARESLMIVPQKQEYIDWDIKQEEGSIKLLTREIQLSVDMDTGAFTYFNANGNAITSEPKHDGKTLIPVDVVKSVFEETSEIKTGLGVDGIRVKVDNFKQGVDRRAYHTKLKFEWAENEAIYGLGSHEEGVMNLRGTHQYLYQQNMKAVVPVLVSTKGYGILIDSYSLMTFHDDMHGSYIWTDIDDEMDYYFIYGPAFDRIISGYRKLTGKAPMLPRWAYGYVQSKERYKTQEELISVVKEYRERKIPLDLIVLDWRSWAGDLWGQKSFDLERFPDPEKMMKRLHDLSARLMVSIWPIMKAGGDNHKDMLEKGYLLGNQANYDPFNEKARELYWKQANEGIFSFGVDAWWCDCTEPFEADWKGEVKPEPEERMRINTEEAKKYLDPEYINAFSLLHSKGIYEGQRATTEDKRVINLTRSSYAGQHRYATVTWSGDIAANWDTLRKQIPAGLNFCITGEPYWTLDIGAFFVGGKSKWSRWCTDESIPAPWFLAGDYDEGCNDMGYKELYVRWFQYGTFLPMFRSHGTDTPREVWRFGEAGSIFYDILVKFDYLRYRLIPYIYSLAGKVAHDDYTIMRALAFDFRNDTNTYSISDQYMFGPAFLVNPVTKPMYYESGSRELFDVDKIRRVYLPKGSDWYDFWSGECFEGGYCIRSKATIDIMPLYIRAGSIVPMGPNIQHTGENLKAPIELRIFGGTDGYFDIYEDEGDNYNYEKGAYSLIGIKWEDKKRRLTFEERFGSFIGMVQSRKFKIVLVSIGQGTGVNETEKADKIVEYDGSKLVVDL